MGVVSDIEQELARLRRRSNADGVCGVRASTMTHVVWCPPRWLDTAVATLRGLEERHPARTIFLVPQPGRRDLIEADVRLQESQLDGLSREILSEVVVIRLRGTPARHPASIVLPLLISDLPAFCRWRGEPDWDGEPFAELVGVCDRIVFDSVEWRSPTRGYERLVDAFGRVAVSDIAYARSLPWRAKLAGRWPGIRHVEVLRVEGPAADSALLTGWLSSRLGRPITSRRRPATVITSVSVDGDSLEPSDWAPPGPSDLLSAQLDVLARDGVYEAAVRSAGGR